MVEFSFDLTIIHPLCLPVQPVWVLSHPWSVPDASYEPTGSVGRSFHLCCFGHKVSG